ncbi:uncharacterized protein K444DRAFT_521322, partial [Hyaloscypha bicolor E]
LYKLIVIDGKFYILALLYSNTIFRLIFIKPFYIGDIKVITNNPESKPIPEFYNKAENNINNNLYKNSYQVKITSLLEKNIFKIISRSQILKEIYIFNSRFINKIKNKNIKKEFKKSRLVI